MIFVRFNVQLQKEVLSDNYVKLNCKISHTHTHTHTHTSASRTFRTFHSDITQTFFSLNEGSESSLPSFKLAKKDFCSVECVKYSIIIVSDGVKSCLQKMLILVSCAHQLGGLVRLFSEERRTRDFRLVLLWVETFFINISFQALVSKTCGDSSGNFVAGKKM